MLTEANVIRIQLNIRDTFSLPRIMPMQANAEHPQQLPFVFIRAIRGHNTPCSFRGQIISSLAIALLGKRQHGDPGYVMIMGSSSGIRIIAV